MSLKYSADNFVTQEEVRAWLEMEPAEWPDAMTLIVNGICGDVETYLGRPVKQRDNQVARYDGTGGRTLYLRPIPNDPVLIEVLDNADNVLASYTATDWWAKVEIGEVVLRSGFWPYGIQNIKVTSSIGWATVPRGILEATLEWIKTRRQRQERSGDAIQSVSIQGQSTTYVNEPMPKHVKAMLDMEAVPGGFGARGGAR